LVYWALHCVPKRLESLPADSWRQRCIVVKVAALIVGSTTNFGGGESSAFKNVYGTAAGAGSGAGSGNTSGGGGAYGMDSSFNGAGSATGSFNNGGSGTFGGPAFPFVNP
jgi:hypothetical protein